MTNLTIGEVAKRANLPAKTIRYYEDIGLITPLRDSNGYRVFRDSDFHKLTFLGRARALGFTIEDCRTLLALYEDDSRASADVKAIAQKHLTEIEAKITDLQAMHATLSELSQKCCGDARPDCPILEGLSGQAN
ncbi:Cu(I)-responsive transcriptional regulator [Tropicibacter sp. R15_0]|uniref:Cu(I)-responsive transcriptional regulator n=1 Tax=Tropicibacter sp. R15_0 TaxID=2821101 RepID=UPI001ADA9201|nr:Cu(I)-responsive transcriptional regulator [Tropicibacter sp. R15_0]MBO9465616.1 Cu(I)-responsive transcriptional regulator [Tropicibacter sp. R15_0]